MTMPYVPAQAPGGYRQMGGGYDEAIAAARGQPVPQVQQPVQQQTMLGQLAAVASMPGMITPEMGWTPPPAINDPRFAAARQPVAAPAAVAPAAPVQDYLAIPLNDPRLPTHLRGRSVGQIIQIAEGLRSVHLQGNQPVAAPVAAPVAQPAPAAQAPGAFDWRNPRQEIAQVVADVIDQRLMPRLQPALNQVQGNSINAAEAAVAQEFGATYEDIKPLVHAKLQGVTDGNVLANPQTWRMVANQVIGELWTRSRQQAPAQQQVLAPNAPGMHPAAPTGPQPVPNLSGFFSEQPNQGGPAATMVTLSPAMEAARAAMGMSREDYIAWGGGVRGGGQ